MADDPLSLQTQMRENAERREEIKKQLGELEPPDMAKNSPLQHELSRLMEKHQQLKDRWEKVLTGQSPEQ